MSPGLFFCLDGDMDSILNSANVDSNELSPLTSSQESSVERSLKNTYSPKYKHSLKDSLAENSKDILRSKDRAQSLKDTCTGEAHVMIFTCFLILIFFFSFSV